jgi:uncharacterized protein YecE (DUF72 family)
MTEILIGSAGWSYEDWAGKVYPDPAPKGFDPLAFLAQYVDCIEINSSFYRPPTAAMSESWARRTPDRIRRAADALRGWAPLVIELRHTSWLEALDFLQSLELNFCNIDQPKASTSITGTRLVTGSTAYIRLHGRNAKAWFSKEAGRDEKYDYLYSRGELRAWEEAIREMEAEKLYVILNNHFQGKALANAFMLMRALGKELAPPPETLRSAYPGVLA